MARSPLKATAPGTTAGLPSRELPAVPIRALGGLSSFGQPVERNESVNKHNGSPNLLSHRQNPLRSCPVLGIKPKLHCNQGKTQKRRMSGSGSFAVHPTETAVTKEMLIAEPGAVATGCRRSTLCWRTFPSTKSTFVG